MKIDHKPESLQSLQFENLQKEVKWLREKIQLQEKQISLQEQLNEILQKRLDDLLKVKTIDFTLSSHTFPDIVDMLSLRFPIAEIARRTKESKGNVSQFYHRKKPASKAFLEKFHEGFRNEIASKQCSKDSIRSAAAGLH